MSASIRSFIAFDLNSDAVLGRLTEMQSLLAETGADLKLVDPKNIHVTMHFLGNIAPNTVEQISIEMQKVEFRPFDIQIQGVGAFPNIRYPRVCWAGIVEGADQLRNIFNQLEPKMQNLGFAADPKGFSPHLTIARVRSGRNRSELAKFIERNVRFDFGIVKANCLKLKKSDLTPNGPVYSTLKEHCPQK